MKYDILTEKGFDVEECVQRMNRKINPKKQQFCPPISPSVGGIVETQNGNYLITFEHHNPMVKSEYWTVTTYQTR